MPITPFLRNEAFDPELIEAMSAAFVRVCSAIGLHDRSDPMTETVARHIIELAQRGIGTAEALYESAMLTFTAYSE